MRTTALVLSLVLIFMTPWEGVIRFPGLGTGVRVLGLLMGAIWLVNVLTTNQLRRPRPFHLLLLLFVLWNAVSIFWSASPNRTVSRFTTWVQLLGMAFILWDLYTTRATILAGLQMYIFGAYVAVGSAIANYLSGTAFYDHYMRYSPGNTNPDGFGFTLALGVPLAWHLASSADIGKKGNWVRFVNYAYIPAAFIGISLSGTRTALIASAVGMLYGLTTLTRVRLWVRAVILLLFVGFAFYAVPALEELRSFQRLGTTVTELTEGDLNNRRNVWEEGWATFLEHPILGVGSNMYPTTNTWGKAAHNSFLSILVELGLVGLALFAAILLIAFSEARRLPKWESLFWMTVLFVWGLGSSTLTWGHRKPTILFLSLLIASAALVKRREVPLVETNEIEAEVVPSINPGHGPRSSREEPYLA